MELRSRVLAKVDTGDSGPGVPGPLSLVTEGSGEPVPDSVPSPSSMAEVAGASLSHPDTAGLMRTPIAGSSQMLGSIGAVVNPDVHADVLVSEAGTEVRPIQPPHPLLIVDVPSGYPEDLETFCTPDTVDIMDILSVDVTHLASGALATLCRDMSVPHLSLSTLVHLCLPILTII